MCKYYIYLYNNYNVDVIIIDCTLLLNFIIVKTKNKYTDDCLNCTTVFVFKYYYCFYFWCYSTYSYHIAQFFRSVIFNIHFNNNIILYTQ